jgi:hypothetical protein
VETIETIPAVEPPKATELELALVEMRWADKELRAALEQNRKYLRGQSVVGPNTLPAARARWNNACMEYARVKRSLEVVQ